MYDRTTRTLWNQFTGEPVLGSLADDVDGAGEPLRLSLLPLVLTTWEDWLAQHPETTVLDIRTGYARLYEPGAAYADYFATEGTMFPVRPSPGELGAKTRIFGLEFGDQTKAYPIEAVLPRHVVNDRPKLR